jgi:hypothetical protein
LRCPSKTGIQKNLSGSESQTDEKKLSHKSSVEQACQSTMPCSRALHDLAVKLLQQYEADDGPLTAGQVRQIKKRVPQGAKHSVRSSLFDTETT